MATSGFSRLSNPIQRLVPAERQVLHALVLLSMRAGYPASYGLPARCATLFGQGKLAIDVEVPAHAWRSGIRLASADDKRVIA